MGWTHTQRRVKQGFNVQYSPFWRTTGFPDNGMDTRAISDMVLDIEDASSPFCLFHPSSPLAEAAVVTYHVPPFTLRPSYLLSLPTIQLWIMPAFGARPQFDNKQELEFYGQSMWSAIVDICLPFGIFYRMHAVASLLEVYIMS